MSDFGSLGPTRSQSAPIIIELVFLFSARFCLLFSALSAGVCSTRLARLRRVRISHQNALEDEMTGGVGWTFFSHRPDATICPSFVNNNFAGLEPGIA